MQYEKIVTITRRTDSILAIVLHVSNRLRSHRLSTGYLSADKSAVFCVPAPALLKGVCFWEGAGWRFFIYEIANEVWMFIDRKLECHILAYASRDDSSATRIRDAKEEILEKRPRTKDIEVYEHLKRLHDLKYVECPDCTLGFDTEERTFSDTNVSYSVTESGKNYLQAMLESDLFEF